MTFVQVTTDEFNHDVKHLFALVKNDSFLDDVLSDMSHQRATDAVSEAINFIYTAESDHQEKVISSEVCIIISLLQQWFVRYLCKKLLQLLTPEALIVNRSKIPSSYVTDYLSYQSHFSLKELIKSYYCPLEASQWYVHHYSKFNSRTVLYLFEYMLELSIFKRDLCLIPHAPV